MLAVLERFGITSARRATSVDATEEVIILSVVEFAEFDVPTLTAALYEVLPHTKVWVAPASDRWVSEDL